MEIKISVTQHIFNEGPPSLGHDAGPSGYSSEPRLSSIKIQSLGGRGWVGRKPRGHSIQQKLWRGFYRTRGELGVR